MPKKSEHDLRDLRLGRGRPGKPYTLEEVSAITGLGPSHLSRSERGLRHLSPPALHSLATFYGLSLEQIERAAEETARRNVDTVEKEAAPRRPMRDAAGEASKPTTSAA